MKRADANPAVFSPGAFNPCAIVPVYNHEEPVVRVTAALRDAGLPVILVDDGCEPACAAVLRKLSATDPAVALHLHAQNRGKGGAVKTAMAAALAAGYSHALQVDADGQHDLADITKFIETARRHPDALILGQPVFDDSIPTLRKFARYLTHGLVALNTLTGRLIDAMCGFRLYPVARFNQIISTAHTGDRMDFDPEILVRWCWQGWPMETLSTRVHYPEDGKSHFRMVQDNVFITLMHLRLFVGMVVRLPVLLMRKRRAT